MSDHSVIRQYCQGPSSPRDEALLITCLSAKGLRVVSKSEFCADFKK